MASGKEVKQRATVTGGLGRSRASINLFTMGGMSCRHQGERIEAFLERNPHMREITEEQIEGKDLETLTVFAAFMEMV